MIVLLLRADVRNTADQRNKTEIVLLITPHIVRNLVRPDTVALSYPSGTDASLRGENRITSQPSCSSASSVSA